MAFTNQQIIDAYNQEVGKSGMSEAQFVNLATNTYGVSADQLSSARGQMLGGSSPAPAPSYSPAAYTTPAYTGPAYEPATALAAPAPAPAPAWTQTQLNSAYSTERNNGASDADLYNLATNQFGVSADQFNLAKMAYQPTATATPTQNWTAGQLNTAYATEKSRSPGVSDDALYQAANSKFGVTREQFDAASKAYAGYVPGAIWNDTYGLYGTAKWDAPGSRTTWTDKPSDGKGGVLDPIHMEFYNLVRGGNTAGAAEYAKAKGWDANCIDQTFTRNGITSKMLGANGTTNTPNTTTNPLLQNPRPTTGINLSNLQNAQMWSVQPNQTVQSQLQDIIASDSPLMQQARARAMQQANARGLLNSSIATTAGESALYDVAMPIAQQDAGTFADAGKFNTGEANTFARDNNAFTRDAFMADFNLAANEWAKTQDQYRLFDQMGYQQKLTLDRDAIQNGYQSARDAILNGYTVARDATTNQYTLQRDATQQGYTKANTADQNAFTKSQQDAQNAYAAAEAEKDRVATERRAAMGIQAPNPDTSVLRTQMQIDADTANRADSAKTTAQTNLYNAKTQWGSKIIDINTGNLTADQKTAALVTLTSTYSPIISSYAVQAGLDPAAEVVGLRYEAPAAGTTTTPTNVVNNVTQGGDGG